MHRLSWLCLSSTNFRLGTYNHLIRILLVLLMMIWGKFGVLIWSDSSSTHIVVSWSWWFWFLVHVSTLLIEWHSTFKTLRWPSFFQGFGSHLVHLSSNLLLSLSFRHALIDQNIHQQNLLLVWAHCVWLAFRHFSIVLRALLFLHNVRARLTTHICLLYHLAITLLSTPHHVCIFRSIATITPYSWPCCIYWNILWVVYIRLRLSLRTIC